MQKISFGGKEYVRASEIAKKFRYTQDYVGQLCRSKKVDARRVGRIWYVVPDSVIEYQKTKHKTQKLAAKKPTPTASAKTRTKRSAKKVEPVTRGKTIKLTRSAKVGHVGNIQISYSPDDSTLVPVLGTETDQSSSPAPKKKSVVTIEAQPAAAVPVVSKKTKETKFSSEKLPEISLSGKLKVTDQKTDTSEETGEESTVAEKKPEQKPAKKAETSATIDLSTSKATDSGEVSDGKHPKKTFLERVTSQKTPNTPQKSEFTPAVVAKKQKPAARSLDLVFLLGAIALVLSVLILSASYEISVTDGADENRLNFDLRNVHVVTELWQ